jgi:hypothetical protein
MWCKLPRRRLSSISSAIRRRHGGQQAPTALPLSKLAMCRLLSRGSRHQAGIHSSAPTHPVKVGSQVAAPTSDDQAPPPLEDTAHSTGHESQPAAVSPDNDEALQAFLQGRSKPAPKPILKPPAKKPSAPHANEAAGVRRSGRLAGKTQIKEGKPLERWPRKSSAGS